MHYQMIIKIYAIQTVQGEWIFRMSNAFTKSNPSAKTDDFLPDSAKIAPFPPVQAEENWSARASGICRISCKQWTWPSCQANVDSPFSYSGVQGQCQAVLLRVDRKNSLYRRRRDWTWQSGSTAMFVWCSVMTPGGAGGGCPFLPGSCLLIGWGTGNDARWRFWIFPTRRAHY